MADANDAESWMNEKEPLVTNPDFGKDEDTAQVNVQFISVNCLNTRENYSIYN